MSVRRWSIESVEYENSLFVDYSVNFQAIATKFSRRDACLTLCFQKGCWMLFTDRRNSNKMTAVYTVHTSYIGIFNSL